MIYVEEQGGGRGERLKRYYTDETWNAKRKESKLWTSEQNDRWNAKIK